MNNSDIELDKKIFSLYYAAEPQVLKTLDLCRGDSDFRKVYITSDNQKKLVIKHTSNSFTDGKRICAWARLIDEYNKIDIYCPHIVPNRMGKLFYKYEDNGHDYYIYAEEFAKYQTAEQIGADKLRDGDGKECYFDDMLRSVGKVAAQHFDFCDFASGYCLLEPFSPPDTTDEATETAIIFRDFVKENIPKYYPRVEKLMELFYQNQAQLRKLYSKLPLSCFQADLNDSNVLLDENNNFNGLIDFNLSGKESVLNYTVRASFWYIPSKKLRGENGECLYFYDEKLDELRMRLFLDNIKCIEQTYAYSNYEREVFPVLLRYLNSFWWHHVNDIKDIKDDDAKIESLLRWLERQMTRDDIRLP